MYYDMTLPTKYIITIDFNIINLAVTMHSNSVFSVWLSGFVVVLLRKLLAIVLVSKLK